MGMSVIIDRADEADSEQILKLQYLCYQSEAELYGDYRIAPLTQTLDGLRAELDEGPVMAARLGDEVVGSVRGRVGEDGVAAIGRLIVHPRLRRHGLGRRLLTAVEGELAAIPAPERFRLRAGHRSEGHLRLYRQLGYTITGSEEISNRFRLVALEKQLSDAGSTPAATLATAG